MRPRTSHASPAASRLSASVAPFRPGREQHHVGDDLAMILKLHRARGSAQPRHASDLAVEAQTDAAIAQIMDKLIDQFAVDETKQAVARLNQGHFHIERGEYRGVFDADHAGADHRQRTRHALEFEDFVGIDDELAVERNMFGPVRPGADSDDDAVPMEMPRLAAFADHFNRVRAQETRRANGAFDIVARELVLQHFNFVVEGDVRGAGANPRR